MQFVATVILLAVLSVAVLLLDLTVAGVAVIFGASFKVVFLKGLWALAIAPCLLLYGRVFEVSRAKVTEVEIVSDKIPASFDGYRFVQLSDIHLLSFANRDKALAKFVDKVNSLNPDAVFFTGDLQTMEPSELDGKEEILKGLAAPDGVFSILGNHDYSIYAFREGAAKQRTAVKELIERERAMGWRLLLNESAVISRPAATASSGNPALAGSAEVSALASSGNGSGSAGSSKESILVAGVENISASPQFPSPGDLDKALQGAPKGLFTILLSHDPSHWRKETANRDDIDLMLSGHTHAMQFTLFGWSPSKWAYPQWKGLYRGSNEISGLSAKVKRTPQTVEDEPANNLLYVNIGLGETGINTRIGALPEMTLFTLRKAK